MLEQVFRDDWGRALASLVGVLGAVELAEDGAARFPGGELVRLDDQDRSLWDQHLIEEGRDLLERAPPTPAAWS